MDELIEQYQCPGCVCGSDTECGKYEFDEGNNNCKGHCIGTMVSGGVGKILLGFPKGFSRIGFDTNIKPWFYKNVNDFQYDKFNIPVWKHKTKEGHILVKGLMPRLNQTFLQVFSSGDIDKIKAFEITEIDMNSMD